MSEHVLKAESEEDPERAQDDDTGIQASTSLSPTLLAVMSIIRRWIPDLSVSYGAVLTLPIASTSSRYLHRILVCTYKEDALCSLD